MSKNSMIAKELTYCWSKWYYLRSFITFFFFNERILFANVDIGIVYWKWFWITMINIRRHKIRKIQSCKLSILKSVRYLKKQKKKWFNLYCTYIWNWRTCFMFIGFHFYNISLISSICFQKNQQIQRFYVCK